MSSIGEKRQRRLLGLCLLCTASDNASRALPSSTTLPSYSSSSPSPLDYHLFHRSACCDRLSSTVNFLVLGSPTFSEDSIPFDFPSCSLTAFKLTRTERRGTLPTPQVTPPQSPTFLPVTTIFHVNLTSTYT